MQAEDGQASARQEASVVRTKAAARIAAISILLVGIASWFPIAWVEDGALSHPDHPTALYTHPLHVKGVIRYVTAFDATLDVVAQVTFFSGVIAFLALANFSLRDGKSN